MAELALYKTHMTFWRDSSRLKRIASISIFGLIFVYVLLCVCVQVHEQVVRSRSEALYAEFLRMQPGVTTKTDVEALRKKWGGKLSDGASCYGDECDYTIGTVWGYSQWFLITRYAHDHAPSSMLELETKGNYLLRSSFSARVVVPAGYGTREERKFRNDPNFVAYSSSDYMLFGRASLSAVLPRMCCEGSLPLPARGYRVERVNCMNCIAVRVSALPSVAQETRASLFRINFSCMTRWSVCTDKEDLMLEATKEESKENASDNELEDIRRACIYEPEALAAAANDAVEIQILSELSSAGTLKVKVLRYIGGTHPLRTGQDMTLDISRENNSSAALQQARASGGRMIVLYTGASYGEIYPYDQCGLLSDDALETVSRNFQLLPE